MSLTCLPQWRVYLPPPCNVCTRLHSTARKLRTEPRRHVQQGGDSGCAARGLGARALALRERNGLVHGGHVEGLGGAVGPTDFEPVNFRRGAEAEVEAGVVLGCVA